MRASITTLSVLAMLLSLATFATADLALDDQNIKLAVEKKLDHKHISNGNGPFVEVDKGVVTLSGRVKSVWGKNEAIKRALGVNGVKTVQDELEIAFGESDKKVAEAIAQKIRTYAFYTVYDNIEMSINEGHVKLDGRVTMPFKADVIEEMASKVMGVQSVASSIETLPVNIGDDRLRRSLYARIYSDTLFSHTRNWIDPPVHIVVERGHVTLTGGVNSKVEKRKAEVIARTTFGVFSVKNELSVGS